MPELPEVENVRLGLNRFLNKSKNSNRIVEIVYSRRHIRNEIPQKEINSLCGVELMPIQRRGKYLIFPTHNGSLLNHLGMTGSWRVLDDSGTKNDSAETTKKHDHLKIILEGHRTLIYNDPRRFGIVDFIESESNLRSPWLDHLGVEPLTRAFSGKVLKSLIFNKSAPIKNVLLDQSCIVGIGNIYASEILFSSGIKPRRACNTLKLSDCEKIVRSTKLILSEAIKSGGSTIKNYRNAEGQQGSYSQKFKVYGREGLNCQHCHNLIKKENMAGRSTYWCPSCQK